MDQEYVYVPPALNAVHSSILLKLKKCILKNKKNYHDFRTNHIHVTVGERGFIRGTEGVTLH
jgi:hypothetical protein